MERHIDHLSMYRGPNDPDGDRVEILCRVMSLALVSYNELVGDMIKGNLRPDVYPSWVDFDGCRCYSVVEIGAVNAAQYHLPPDTTGLVVCYDDAVLAGVASLEAALDLIAEACGRRVVLVPERERGVRVWWPEPVGDPGEPPREP
jgi:hypothetical protein